MLYKLFTPKHYRFGHHALSRWFEYTFAVNDSGSHQPSSNRNSSWRLLERFEWPLSLCRLRTGVEV